MKKILLTSTLISLTYSSSVFAFGGNFTIMPEDRNNKWVEEKIAKGTQVSKFIYVINNDNKVINLDLEFSETSGTRENIHISSSSNSIKKWVKYPDKTTLQPFEKKKLEVIINIPNDVESKTYQGVLLASMSSSNKDLLTVKTQIGTRFYIEVTEGTAINANIFSTINIITEQILILLSIGFIMNYLYSTQWKKVTSKS
jgi:hypothetical protein